MQEAFELALSRRGVEAILTVAESAGAAGGNAAEVEGPLRGREGGIRWSRAF
jgi:hypothetical protein